MDLMVVLIVMTALGGYKVYKTKPREGTPSLNVDGTFTNPEGYIPVGNNLLLYREPDAFTKILKELRLE